MTAKVPSDDVLRSCRIASWQERKSPAEPKHTGECVEVTTTADFWQIYARWFVCTNHSSRSCFRRRRVIEIKQPSEIKVLVYCRSLLAAKPETLVSVSVKEESTRHRPTIAELPEKYVPMGMTAFSLSCARIYCPRWTAQDSRTVRRFSDSYFEGKVNG